MTRVEEAWRRRTRGLEGIELANGRYEGLLADDSEARLEPEDDGVEVASGRRADQERVEFVHVKIGEVTDDVDAGQLPPGGGAPFDADVHHSDDLDAIESRDTGEMAARDEAVADEPDARRTRRPSCRCRRTQHQATRGKWDSVNGSPGAQSMSSYGIRTPPCQIEPATTYLMTYAERRRSEVLGVDPCHTMASWKPP